MRKILCIVLAFVISSLSITTYVLADDNETTNNTTPDLHTEQEQLQQQIEDANEELDNVQDELSENLQQVKKLDDRITESQTELDELNTKITKLQNSIEKVEGELNVAEEKYNKQKEVLEQRLVIMYEAGDMQYLDVILSSKSISEFLSNYFLITELTKYDTDLLEEMEQRKNTIENTKSVRENYISKLSNQEKEIQSKIDEYNARFTEINQEILALAIEGLDTKYIGGELAWPVPGYTRISSKYGMRTHPITGVYKLHTGTDISAPMGANFIAANDGIVIKAGYNSAYGNMVIIDHGGGISTLYAHGSEILVQVGQIVKRGEAILKVGSTGYSTGPHAHFEVRINGVVTDPMPYITNGVIPKSTNENQQNTSNDNTNNTTN